METEIVRHDVVAGEEFSDSANSWIEDWFNSPYYFKLYKNRDETEARHFIDRLLTVLKPAPDSSILDLACGRGRYSRYLAEKGFNVTGIDIAGKSISHARQFENDSLSFFVHDMRVPFRVNYFDYVFNFFTSFGYFETEAGHLKSVCNIGRGLRTDGKFVLDFFNSKKIISNLRAEEIKSVDELDFHIKRSLDNKGYVEKSIEFEDDGHTYHFVERVRAYTLDDFEVLFRKAGMKIDATYGDYLLNDFDESNSARLILVGCKSGC